MRWTLAALCSIAGIVDLRLAAAEPAPVTAPPAAPPARPTAAPAAAPATPAADPRSDAGWQLYHDTFAALMHGERTRARDLASALLRDHPDHPATRIIRGAHLGLAPGTVDDRAAVAQRPEDGSASGPGGAGPDGEDREDREDRDVPSSGARAELALFQSLHGVAVGIEACIALKCDSGESFLGIALAGGAAGGLISVNLHDLTPGQRALLNSGTAWGAANATLLLIAKGSSDASNIALTLIAGQGAGLLGGALLFNLHPMAGQVALANSGGEWSGVLTGLAFAALGSHASNQDRAITAVVAIDAGIAAGAYLASRWPRVSRAQTLVIDAGGIVGTIGGGGLGVLISGDAGDRTTPGIAAVGAVIGLGAAAYFTRDWNDDGASSVHAYVAPPEHGRGGIAGVGFRW